MSTAASNTGRAPKAMRIKRDEVIDGAFVFALGVLALIGFRTTYGGWAFFAVGLIGLVLGIVIAHLADVLHQPAITIVAITITVFFLFGGALAMHEQAIGGVLPTDGTLSGLARTSVDGWKDVVTAIPPIGSTGGLLAIPYILGLFGGACGFALARRFAVPVVGAIAPTVMLVLVILLGTDHPAARLLQGMVFGVVLLCWLVERSQRRRPPVRSGSGRRARAVTAAAVVLLTAVGTMLSATHLPGASSHDRVVLRSYVEPPFDINAYPSPLAGLRQYEGTHPLAGKPLFTVRGIPAGDQGRLAMRIATLDDYDGSVWAATNGTLHPTPGEAPDVFERGGTQLASAAQGRPVTLSVSIAAAYANSVSTTAWVPTAGHVTSISFTSNDPDHSALANSLRFNPATESTVAPALLRPGDSYTLHADIPVVLPSIAPTSDCSAHNAPIAASMGSFGDPQVDPAALPSSGFTAAIQHDAQSWQGTSNGAGAEIDAIGCYLRTHGYYSDGGHGEGQYYPGHGLGRLSEFLGVSNPPGLAPYVGDNEQYAAVFALLVNEIGIPVRVELVGIPESGSGVVDGTDVHAWVQVHVQSGAWVDVPQSDFMPPTSRTPKPIQPQSHRNTDTTIPPPVTAHQPASAADSGQGRVFATRRAPKHHGLIHVPDFVVAVAKYVGPPLLAVLAWVGLVVGVKSRRRQLRRSRGPTPLRFSAGWREVLDQAVDLGAVIPTGLTRREQARSVASVAILPVADGADAGIFGPGLPSENDATQYWKLVDRTRAQMTAGVGRWRRLRAAMSLRSLRWHPERPERARGRTRPRTTGAAS